MSKRRKKRKHEEGHIDESWLLPYSDLLTLLLALFIVLYAVSSSDSEKMKKMSDVFNQIFLGNTGIMDESSPYSDTSVAQAAEKIILEEQLKKKDAEDPQKPLKEIQQQMNAYISANQLENNLETNLTEEGLLIRIKSEILFDSGKADLKQEQLLIAQDIAATLVSTAPLDIVVSGHADNVPISNSKYRSNWDLSFDRARSFLTVMSQNTQLNQNRFSLKSHGDTVPIASNDTEEGRATNRRVEVFISPAKQAVSPAQ
ncbi:flagellar motor protein MotB [Priestia taiwanensis]|uniref:Motility protein B n=1 Tax=Priestia taiwanensis TaxID=1347902 RepID=A0A917AUK0_9BACI|nr:flagellar motor protein MotB [Priestia taiwanensis]MBM7364010.1 chemotaxis protein MotB [Priestia taiwanensis]GGE70945.1 motility protein B [Priestia taiwanensis]